MIVVGTVGPFNEGTDYVEGWKLADKLGIPMVDEHYYQSRDGSCTIRTSMTSDRSKKDESISGRICHSHPRTQSEYRNSIDRSSLSCCLGT